MIALWVLSVDSKSNLFPPPGSKPGISAFQYFNTQNKNAVSRFPLFCACIVGRGRGWRQDINFSIPRRPRHRSTQHSSHSTQLRPVRGEYEYLNIWILSEIKHRKRKMAFWARIYQFYFRSGKTTFEREDNILANNVKTSWQLKKYSPMVSVYSALNWLTFFTFCVNISSFCRDMRRKNGEINQKQPRIFNKIRRLELRVNPNNALSQITDNSNLSRRFSWLFHLVLKLNSRWQPIYTKYLLSISFNSQISCITLIELIWEKSLKLNSV